MKFPSINIFNPCCSLHLLGGVKALAITEVAVELSVIVAHTASISADWSDYIKLENSNVDKYMRPFQWGYIYINSVISIFNAYFLHRSARKRSEKGLILWMKFALPLLSILLIILITHLIRFNQWNTGNYSHPTCLVVCAALSAFKVYLIWTVWRYIREIQYYGGLNNAIRELPDNEVQEFFEGQEKAGKSRKFERRPYKRNYEILPENLDIDERCPLGQGNYGVVFKAEYTNPISSVVEIVAVKTLAKNAELEYFRALLSELKILSYIGEHEHLVNLIGASTDQIKQRKINVVVEFCPYGNLQNYLRSTRGLFIHSGNYDEEYPRFKEYIKPTFNGSMVCQLSTLPRDLIKWAMQTASGMEYISRMKVVHGDLAARNVLLTYSRDVKIADFGLSRQLYNCNMYIKRKIEPVPWKWLAVESLTDMHFSTQSDIWAFGICLWEYFTLGCVPYQGDLDFSNDFLIKLKSGELRPEKPPYATPEIYSKMSACWDSNPDKRPTFKTLKDFFQEMLVSSNAHMYFENEVRKTSCESGYLSDDNSESC